MHGIAELADAIDRHVHGSGICTTVLPRVSLIRTDRPSTPTPSVYEASLCLIAQGSKRVSIGEHSVVYDAAHYLLVSVDLPLVGCVIAAIRRGFDRRMSIDEIAAEAGMSPSSLHAHFKAVTRLTPLEYQKQLRLREARRLMLMAGATAGTAGFAVGYESPSQFSREYRRLFGAPPRQDIERLHAVPAANIAL